jgi:hypothetical protein
VTPIWTETYAALEVEDGLFTVYLGSVTPLAFEDLIQAAGLWLGVKVGTDSEMDRISLGTVPFAMEAYQCQSVGGLQEGDIQPMLAGANQCGDGEFLRGWDADLGQPICDAPDPGMVATEWTNADIAWTDPYSDSGSYSSSLQYRKLGDMVFLRGTGNSGGTHVLKGQTIATLPSGYRPVSGASYLTLIRFPNETSGVAEIYISTGGAISVSNLVVDPGDKQFIYFDGINFASN